MDVREAVAREEIRDAVMRYCRGVDRIDGELIRSAYHADGYDDHGPIKGTVDEFVSRIVPILRDSYTSTTHSIGTQCIEVDGDVAFCESYYTTTAVHEVDGVTIHDTAIGRYVDRLERRPGVGWRISQRVAVLDAERSEAVSPMRGDLNSAEVVRGRRDRDDPSYDRRRRAV